MKKKSVTPFFYSLLLAMALFSLTSCNNTKVNDSNGDSTTDATLNPPLLSLNREEDSSPKQFTVKSKTFSWGQDGHSIDSDGSGPLDKTYPPMKIHLPTDSFLLSFTEKPDSYTVGYWTDDNIGKENPDFMTDITVTDDRISLPDASKGYVFEIHGIWKQGDALYHFHVLPD